MSEPDRTSAQREALALAVTTPGVEADSRMASRARSVVGGLSTLRTCGE
ncbi:hypothetical protein ACFTWH_18670 [Streptomyces sp. NPDC057011]